MNTIDALLFDEKFHIHKIGERKKHVQIKGMISNTLLLVCQYIVKLVISDSCTNFQNSSQVVTEKSLKKTSIKLKKKAK